MGLSDAEGWSRSLVATVDHVWGGDDQVDVTTTDGGSAGWPTIESYRLAPNARSARYLLPATSRKAAAGSIRSYNQLRLPRTRAARTVLGALVAGGGQRLLRERLHIAVDPALARRSYPEHVLTQFLAAEIGAGDVRFALGVHDQTPNSKPTLQAFGVDGAPRGFAKVGWNRVTRDQVATEATALRHLKERPAVGIETPVLLHAGTWRGRELLVTAPMPLTVRPWHELSVAPDVATVCRIADVGRACSTALVGSAQVTALHDRALSPAWDPAVSQAVRSLLGRLTARFPTMMLRFGAWHGDWVPWNLARRDTALVVWDWEQFRDRDVAVGLDSVHWHFQVSFVLQRESLGAALRKAHDRARRDLESIQGPGTAPVCLALYALELTARYEDMRGAGAGPTDRFHDDILTELRAIGSGW